VEIVAMDDLKEMAFAIIANKGNIKVAFRAFDVLTSIT